MEDLMKNIKVMVEDFGTAPLLEEMPKRTLLDKGINGPTGAHVIEEVHCPFNLSYLTFTTGSSAFQNIVGVTHSEIDNRVKVTQKIMENIGVKPGSKILFTYPPLVNVFSREALEENNLNWCFLKRSSRDAFLVSLYEENPDVIVGESTFIKVSLEDSKKMGIASYLPQKKIILTAGTPLDLELLDTAENVINSEVHDLYGCQEFGWLTIDGISLREDLSFISSPLGRGNCEVVVGGLPMGDSFVLSDSGHVCDKKGRLITYRRSRTYPEYEVIVKETTLSSKESINKAARTILRIKSRVVKVDPDVKTSASKTVLELKPGIAENKGKNEVISGPEKTVLFDDMVKAQLNYQQTSKKDPTWIKRR